MSSFVDFTELNLSGQTEVHDVLIFHFFIGIGPVFMIIRSLIFNFLYYRQIYFRFSDVIPVDNDPVDFVQICIFKDTVHEKQNLNFFPYMFDILLIL